MLSFKNLIAVAAFGLLAACAAQPSYRCDCDLPCCKDGRHTCCKDGSCPLPHGGEHRCPHETGRGAK